jgi:hypothetical protein
VVGAWSARLHNVPVTMQAYWDTASRCFRLDGDVVVGQVHGNHLDQVSLELDHLLDTTVSSLQTAVSAAWRDSPGTSRAKGAMPSPATASSDALDESRYRAIDDACPVTLDLSPAEYRLHGTICLDFASAGVVFAEIGVSDPLEAELGLAVEVLGALARAKGYILESLLREPLDTMGPEYFVLVLRCTDLTTTIGNLVRFQEVANELLRMPALELSSLGGGSHFHWDLARRMLTYGHTEYLLRQTEASWLEVKSRGYNCDEQAQQIELAQDVARFANGDGPGLLVLGYRTKRVDGRDLIVKHCPQPIGRAACERYRAIIDQRVFPPVHGLTVDHIPHQDGATVVITIPNQAEADRPFLVHGAMVDGRHEGAFISIVRRRGEHSIPVSPMAIHAALAAGRRVLRGEVGSSKNHPTIGPD